MNIDTKLEELGDRLERATAAQLRSEQRTSGTVTTRARRKRSRYLASSSLGLAGVGAAVLIALSGTSATTPAFAITRHDNGTVLVQLNRQEDIAQANQKLAAMGINEQITLYMNPNPTTATGADTCTPGPGAGAPDPPISVVVNTDNADNTGTTGAVACVVGPHTYSGPYPGSSGGASSGKSRATTARSTSAG
jgi:hypothetical protein